MRPASPASCRPAGLRRCASRASIATRLGRCWRHGNQLGAILDQFLGPHRKDIELGTADHETDVLEQAADLVLEIALDLDQQRPEVLRNVAFLLSPY